MSNILESILKRLPDVYNKTKESNLGKLLQLAADEYQELEETFNKIEKYRDIDQATGYTLDRAGRNVLQFRGKTTDEVYRTLIKAKIKRNQSDGGINTIIDVVSFLLGIDVTEVYLKEKWPEEKAAVLVSVPPYSLNSIGLSFKQFAQIINTITAGGVSANIQYEGTFAFSSNPTTSEFITDEGFADINKTVGGYFGAYYDPGQDEVLPL